MCGEWCCGMCMGKEYSSDYTGDGPKKAVELMFCAVDGCREPRMPRIGFCSKHNAMSKTLMRIEGMTSPLQLKNKMSQMLKDNLVIKQGRIVYDEQNDGPGIGDKCKFCEEICVNAGHGVCGKHRFFLRLIDKLEDPVHQKYYHYIEKSVQELRECQVSDCLKISAHLNLCKHHFFRYSEIKDIPDRAPTVAHNKRIQMVDSATETGYAWMSTDVQEYMQQQEGIVSDWQESADIITLRAELQSLEEELDTWIQMRAEAEASGVNAQYEAEQVGKFQMEVAQMQTRLTDTMQKELQSLKVKLDEWIQLKAEAVARGSIAVYENQHVETLQRKIIHLETMLVEPAAEDAGEHAAENVRPPSVPPIPRVRSLVEAPAAELHTEFQEHVGIYPGSAVAG
eukprot:SAG11_NODE_476_length_9118_cov_5.515911_4_plen_396_part_00